ncbi:MAG: prolipoprotein diacylglyceryl transferase [Candidatus Ancillula sp.]|jgi:prolipoprotein diacylglyceryl transferase|nr:prolipoprotein diacylglyceryl transferase [Candidatus Ancillula sp.]
MSIPTPPISEFTIGPFTIHFYALCVLSGAMLACLVGVLRSRKLHALAPNTKMAPGVIWDALLVILPCGVIGARLYYVLTLPGFYLNHPQSIFKIWQGGLGIMGGIIFGVVAAWAFCRVRKIDFNHFLWCVVPGIPLAQSVGRLGNWFNAELYGKETDLPWKLDISRGQYQAVTFYHPTFLYEMLWNLIVFSVLLVIFRKTLFESKVVIPAYLALYTFGRVFIETLRIDNSEYILGVRVNIWFAITLLVVSAVWLIFEAKRVNPKPSKQ